MDLVSAQRDWLIREPFPQPSCDGLSGYGSLCPACESTVGLHAMNVSIPFNRSFSTTHFQTLFFQSEEYYISVDGLGQRTSELKPLGFDK